MSYLVSPQYGSQATAIKPSMYETLEPAGFIEELDQHFVEWFSGDQLDSIWTFFDIVGTNSGGMDDTSNGGYKITTGTGSDNSAKISFNNIRHYSETGSKIIAVMQRIDSGGRPFVGLGNDVNDTLNTHVIFAEIDSDDTNIIIWSKDASTWSTSDTGIPEGSVSPFKIAIELRSSSAITYIDDDLVVVKTNNLPNAKCQPFFHMQNRTTAAQSARISYMECYNT